MLNTSVDVAPFPTFILPQPSCCYCCRLGLLSITAGLCTVLFSKTSGAAFLFSVLIDSCIVVQCYCLHAVLVTACNRLYNCSFPSLTAARSSISQPSTDHTSRTARCSKPHVLLPAATHGNASHRSASLRQQRAPGAGHVRRLCAPVQPAHTIWFLAYSGPLCALHAIRGIQDIHG